MKKILIVDASDSDRRLMSGLLDKAGYEPIPVGSMEAATEEVANLPPGAVIVVSMRFTGGTALELINWLKREDYPFPVLAVVENLNNADLLGVMRDGGAKDVIQRPAINKQLVELVSKYAKDDRTEPSDSAITLLTESIAYRQIDRQISVVAQTDSNCIIFGESGVGKEQVARQIVKLSSRRNKPCVEVDADGAALVGTHNPASDRSETYNRIEGYFKKASEGTIIVKNIQLLTFEKQSILLHILSEEHPDVRVICTASTSLLKLVAEERFRGNLFFMLRQTEIVIPSLRVVSDDIPVLADFFLTIFAEKRNEPKKRLDAGAIKALRLHPWPGNVRELKDAIHFAAMFAQGDVITDSDLSLSQLDPLMEEELIHRNPRLQRENIIKAYQRAGSWRGAAKLLQISERALFELRKKLGIDKDIEK